VWFRVRALRLLTAAVAVVVAVMVAMAMGMAWSSSSARAATAPRGDATLINDLIARWLCLSIPKQIKMKPVYWLKQKQSTRQSRDCICFVRDKTVNCRLAIDRSCCIYMNREHVHVDTDV
jgi:hypothetical protein